MKNKTKAGNFHIHAFMFELGLKPGELCLYALLYSFSSNGEGIYFGSQDYLAEVLCMSKRNIRRLLKTLLERGLIEKVVTKGRRGYRCTVTDKNANKTLAPTTPTEPIANDGAADFDEKSSYYNNSENKTDEEEYDDIEWEGAPENVKKALRIHRQVKTKNELIYPGAMKLVWLTKEQYRALAEIADFETIHIYISKLERRIDEGGKSPHCPYKVLKKWLLEDLGA